jgi:hypothetical protein
VTSRGELLLKAAQCYERAELHADAGRCYQQAGRLRSAGTAYANAGELRRAADCFRAGDEFRAAAQLYAEVGQPEAAADCWELSGDHLSAGWVLAIQTSEVNRPLRMLSVAAAGDAGRRLRKDLGIGVCRAKRARRSELLEPALLACESGLALVQRQDDRAEVEEWAVAAASLMGRPDLAARVLAASYRCGTRGVTGRWWRWGADQLGGTFGLPQAESDPAADAHAPV